MRRATAKTLRDARLAKGLTQEKLAEAIRVHQTTVSQWETGSIPCPHGPALLALAGALDVTPETASSWFAREERAA